MSQNIRPHLQSSFSLPRVEATMLFIEGANGERRLLCLLGRNPMISLIGATIGLLAVLSIRKSLGWTRSIALIVLWGVAASSHAGAWVRLWWMTLEWLTLADPFQYGGPAWRIQEAEWLPIAIESFVGAALLLGWVIERRRRA